MAPIRSRSLAAVMFADMVGFTALMARDEDAARAQRDRQRDVVARLVERFGGRVRQYFGDGTLSLFASAVEAARCAVAIQTELRAPPEVSLRIGIHLGDVVEEDDGVYGDGVNVAARVESLAGPGGILVSGKVHDELKNHPDLTAVSLGSVTLKNVSGPVEIFALSNGGAPVPTPYPLAKARRAIEKRSWRVACEAFAAADHVDPLEASDLWQFAMASFLIGEEADFLRALERAHESFLRGNEPLPAVRCACQLGLHLLGQGKQAQGSGWFGRAARLLDQVDEDCAERGYCLLPVALQKYASGAWEGLAEVTADVLEIAQRFADSDLTALALLLRGRALLNLARIDEGLALMDEAMVGVVAGRLSPQITGGVYCSVIGACREVYALRRAQEWSEALEDWCDQQPELVAYTGECRAFRAEVLQRQGRLRAAIDEARRVYERFREGSRPGSEAFALYQLGEAHRLLGEFEAAEEAYREAGRAGREPQPGLALLRLAQGDEGAAVGAIRRAFGEAGDRFKRIQILPAYIEIMLSVGAIGEAKTACIELEGLSLGTTAGVLEAVLAQARGGIALSEERPQEALAFLRDAWTGWRALEVPYEAARVRRLLGQALRALGDEDSAAMELEFAQAELRELGVPPSIALPGPTRHRLDPTGGPLLTKRERDVLSLVAKGGTNRAIANELFISEKTVARHLANIFQKLDVSTRTAAAAYAYQQGLLESPA